MAGIQVTDPQTQQEEMEEGQENGTQESAETAERIIKLPITRIKHLIKMDPDVTLASQDAVVMLAKAAELFIQDLAKHAYSYTVHAKKKTVQKKDLDLAVERLDSLAFLEGTLES